MSHLPPIDSSFLATPAIVITSPVASSPYSTIEESESALALLARQISIQNEVISNAGKLIKLYTKQYKQIQEQLSIQQQIRDLENQMSNPFPTPRAVTPRDRLKTTTNTQELLHLIEQTVEEVVEPTSKRPKYTHRQPAQRRTSSSSAQLTVPPYFIPISPNHSPSPVDQPQIPTPAYSPSSDSTPFDQTPVLMPPFSPYLNSSQFDQTPSVPLQSPTPSPAQLAEIPPRPESPWKRYLQ